MRSFSWILNASHWFPPIWTYPGFDPFGLSFSFGDFLSGRVVISFKGPLIEPPLCFLNFPLNENPRTTAGPQTNAPTDKIMPCGDPTPKSIVLHHSISKCYIYIYNIIKEVALALNGIPLNLHVKIEQWGLLGETTSAGAQSILTRLLRAFACSSRRCSFNRDILFLA